MAGSGSEHQSEKLGAAEINNELGSIEAHPEAVEAQNKAVEPHNGAEEAHPGVVEGLCTVKKSLQLGCHLPNSPGQWEFVK